MWSNGGCKPKKSAYSVEMWSSEGCKPKKSAYSVEMRSSEGCKPKKSAYSVEMWSSEGCKPKKTAYSVEMRSSEGCKPKKSAYDGKSREGKQCYLRIGTRPAVLHIPMAVVHRMTDYSTTASHAASTAWELLREEKIFSHAASTAWDVVVSINRTRKNCFWTMAVWKANCSKKRHHPYEGD